MVLYKYLDLYRLINHIIVVVNINSDYSHLSAEYIILADIISFVIFFITEISVRSSHLLLLCII